MVVAVFHWNKSTPIGTYIPDYSGNTKMDWANRRTNEIEFVLWRSGVATSPDLPRDTSGAEPARFQIQTIWQNKPVIAVEDLFLIQIFHGAVHC